MEVAVSPAVVSSVYSQLKQQNALHRHAFSDVVADYQACLQRSRELQVRRAMHAGPRERTRPFVAWVRASSLPTQWCRPHVQVRNAQLDKEASELRQENETLLRSVEEQKHSAVNSAQVREGPPPPCRCRCRRRRLCTTS